MDFFYPNPQFRKDAYEDPNKNITDLQILKQKQDEGRDDLPKRVVRRALRINKEREAHLRNISEHFKHKNVVRVLHFEIEPHDFYPNFVRYLEIMAQNLNDFIIARGGKLDANRIQTIAYQLLDGCQYLHKHNVVHQNIKPENILGDIDFRVVKLADPGLLPALPRFPSQKNPCLQKTMKMYASPEMHRSFKDGKEERIDVGDSKTDVFSIGVVVFEMFTKELPFTETEVSAIESMSHNEATQMVKDKIAEYNYLEFDVAVALKTMLQFDPNSRPEAAVAMKFFSLRPKIEYYKRDSVPFAGGSFSNVYKCKVRHEILTYTEIDSLPTELMLKSIKVNAKFFSTWKYVNREITLNRKTNHDHVAKMYDYKIDMDKEYAELLLEYCDMNLENFTFEYTKMRAYTEEDVKSWTWQLLTGLVHLQTLKIMHRDIMPWNVLVKLPPGVKVTDTNCHATDCTFKWADFGLSRFTNRNHTSEDSKTVVGNRDFSAPEIACIKADQAGIDNKRGEYDGLKADVFSAGALFYHQLVRETKNGIRKGVMPYTMSELEAKNHPIYTADDPLEKIQPDEFKELLRKMLDWNPAKRPSPTELLDMAYFRKGA